MSHPEHDCHDYHAQGDAVIYCGICDKDLYYLEIGEDSDYWESAE